jgi:hypothetical protein
MVEEYCKYQSKENDNEEKVRIFQQTNIFSKYKK